MERAVVWRTRARCVASGRAGSNRIRSRRMGSHADEAQAVPAVGSYSPSSMKKYTPRFGHPEPLPTLKPAAQRAERPDPRFAPRWRNDPDDARRARSNRPRDHGPSLTRARAISTPHAGAARVDREPDCDRTVSSEAGQEGTRKWHTYRHSAQQACNEKFRCLAKACQAAG